MKKKVLILNLLFLLVLFFPQKTNAHPVHISVTNIDILPKRNKIFFSVRVFINDFNLLINKTNNNHIDLAKLPPLSNIKQFVNTYVSNNLIFFIDNKKNENKISLLRYKINKEGAIWFFFEIPNTNCNFEKISIKNTLLNDLYKDQTNLLILSYNNSQQAYSYNREKTKNLFLVH